jgi:metal-responsive CopG/Arc/MetJ family transcriptional regulator
MEIMLGASIKLNKELLARIKKVADAGGYSSPQEFVEHVLERELAKLEGAVSDEEIAKKLQGLGYLD